MRDRPDRIFQAEEQIQIANSIADDLEPYRHLVKLQKQMIELSEQHEQAKRERDALRKQVARERAEQLRSRRSLRQHLQRSAVKLLKRVPGSRGPRGGKVTGKQSSHTSPC